MLNVSGYTLIYTVGKTVKSGYNSSELSSLDLSDLSTGTYILMLKFKDAAKPSYYKVIKE